MASIRRPDLDDRGGPTRRTVLGLLAALLPATTFGTDAAARGLGEREPFDYGTLIDRARDLASRPYQPPVVAAPEQLRKIDYTSHWKILFREELSLWPAGQGYPVQLFHPARYFPEPVNVHILDGEGNAQQVIFAPDWFKMPEGHPAESLPAETNFAGFRVMRTVPADGSEDGPEKGPKTALGPDWISFLGASYFRSDGPFKQYGLSARGIAIDTGLPTGEEFPRFSAYWIGPPEKPDEDLVVYALLEGPSITGAYRMGLLEHGPVKGQSLHIEAHLFTRRTIQRLGMAPLTSMYWYSERDKLLADDWRPEIHDSDGLAIETGAGERIWRPLRNPKAIRTSSFIDNNPRGFGLIQRDRSFAHYQDDGVWYDKRPSGWVTPESDWGEGWVQLVELPTTDETFDNIVAYFTPRDPLQPGQEKAFSYRLDFTDRDPVQRNTARVVATRQGQGGFPGQEIPENLDKMVVDFEGGRLSDLSKHAPVQAMLDISGGEIVGDYIPRKVGNTGVWRVSFDFRLTGEAPADLRLYLRLGDEALTETWLAQATTDRGL